MNQLPPSSRVIRGDIRKSRCTTGINDTSGEFATCVYDTGGKICQLCNTTPAAKFATYVYDTGGKICHRINDTGGKLCHQFR
jgi:hypothetical protein